jgi:hypothetical protein
MSEARRLDPEPTPVDDVRRIRERLHRQFGGDVRRQAEYARRITEELRERLGLRPAPCGEQRLAPDTTPGNES